MTLNPRQFPMTHVHKNSGRGGFELYTHPDDVEHFRSRLDAARQVSDAHQRSGAYMPDEIMGRTSEQQEVASAWSTIGSVYVCNNPSCLEKPTTFRGKVKRSLKGNAPPADLML